MTTTVRSGLQGPQRPWDSDFTVSLPSKEVSIIDKTTNVLDNRDVWNATLSQRIGRQGSGAIPTNVKTTNLTTIQKSNPTLGTSMNCSATRTGSSIHLRLAQFFLFTMIRPIRRFGGMLVLWRMIECIIVPFISTFFGFGSMFEHGLLHYMTVSAGEFLRSLILIVWATTLFGIVILCRCLTVDTPRCLSQLVTLPFSLSLKKKTNDPSKKIVQSNYEMKWSTWPLSLFSKLFSFQLLMIKGPFIRILIGSVCATATTLAIHLVLPTNTDMINSIILSIVSVTRKISLSWNTTVESHSRVMSGRPTEAVLSILLFFVLPLSIIFNMLPGAAELGQLLGTIIAIPNLPILFLSSASSIPTSSVWPHFLIYIRHLLAIFVTDWIFVSSLDTHEEEGHKALQLNLFKSVEELQTFLEDYSYTSYIISAQKFEKFSRGVPKQFPTHIKFYTTSSDYTTSTDTGHPMATLRPLQLSNITSLNNPSTPGLILHEQTTSIFFGLPFGPHGIYTVPSNNMMNDKRLLSSCHPTRLSPLSTLGWDVPKRIPIGAKTISHSKSFSLRMKQCLDIFSQQGISGFFNKYVGKGLGSASSILVYILPDNFIQLLLIATHGEKKNIPTFLFWDKQPLDTIGCDSEFFYQLHQHECHDLSCCCHKGLILNYWIYEVLINSSGNELWNTYSSKVYKTTEGLSHVIGTLRHLLTLHPLPTPSLNKDHLHDNTSQPSEDYLLPLELLSLLENAFTFLERHFPPLTLGDITRMGRLAEAVRRGTPSVNSSYIVTHPLKEQLPGLRLRMNGLKQDDPHMSLEFNTKLKKLDYQELIKECRHVISAIIPIVQPFSKGFGNWCHIATLLQLQDVTKQTVRHVLPSIVRLADELKILLIHCHLQHTPEDMKDYSQLLNECIQTIDRCTTDYSTLGLSETLNSVINNLLIPI